MAKSGTNVQISQPPPLPAILSTSTSGGSLSATSGSGSTSESHLRDLLSQSESWTLDIFALERISDHRLVKKNMKLAFQRYAARLSMPFSLGEGEREAQATVFLFDW